MISKEDLRELRSRFRKRMKKRDFCLGEREVEEYFRILLRERKKKPEIVQDQKGVQLSSAEIMEIYDQIFVNNAHNIFEKDSVFYNTIMKGKR